MLQKYIVLLTVAGLIFAAGCEPKEPQTGTQNSTPTVSDRDRPPLRIGLITQPSNLEDMIKTRWATVSEQKLEFVSLSQEDLNGTESPQLDLLVAPAMLIGTLVEEKWVSELPNELVQSQLTDENMKGVDPNAFPTHWLTMARYGKLSYGVPFGASLMLVATEAGSSGDTAQVSTADRSVNSMLPSLTIDWARYRLAPPTEANPLSSDIVDQFLVIASSRRPNLYDVSLLFKLVDCNSRLSEPWAIESAQVLRELYQAPQSENRTPIVLGWEQSQSQTNLDWYLPKVKRKTNLASSSNKQSNEMLESREWSVLVDSARAPILYLSSRTRQSSKSIFFLNWMCEQSQRSALAKAWPWSFPTAEGGPPNGYRDIAYRASGTDDISMFPKFRHALRYRSAIHRTLRRIVEEREVNIAKTMEECRLECDQITTTLGRDFQQDSLERAFNLQ
jgi:hypothetical protein